MTKLPTTQVEDPEAFLLDEATRSVERAKLANDTIAALVSAQNSSSQALKLDSPLKREDFPGVSPEAWDIIGEGRLRPDQVFISPKILENNPVLLQYYRLIAGLSRKALGRISLSPDNIERGIRMPKREKIDQFVHALNPALSQVILGFSIKELNHEWVGQRLAGQLILQLHGSQVDAKGDIGEATLRRSVIEVASNNISRYFTRSSSSKGKFDEYAKPGKESNKNSRPLDPAAMISAIDQIIAIELDNGVRIQFSGDPDVTVIKPWAINRPVGLEVKAGTDLQNSIHRIEEAAGSLRELQHRYPEGQPYGVAVLKAVTAKARDRATRAPEIDEVLGLDKIASGQSEHQRFLALLGVLGPQQDWPRE